jgi:tetrahydromethanopterin S-methyltransferase subunit G
MEIKNKLELAEAEDEKKIGKKLKMGIGFLFSIVF